MNTVHMLEVYDRKVINLLRTKNIPCVHTWTKKFPSLGVYIHSEMPITSSHPCNGVSVATIKKT
jgi:hypothetical protein